MSISSSFRLVAQPPLWDTAAGAGNGSIAPLTRRRAPRQRLGRLLVVSDALAATATCLATAAILLAFPSLGDLPGTGLGQLAFLPIASALILVVLAARGSYSSAGRQLTPGVADDLVPLIGRITAAGVLMLAGGALTGLANRVPPAGMVVLVAMAALAVPSARAMALAMAARNPSRVTRVIVVGSGRVAGELARRLERERLVEVVGTVDDEPDGDLDVVGSVDELPRLCRALEADRVVIAFSRRHPSRSAELVLALRDAVEVDVVVRYFELAGWESRLHDVAGLSLLNLGGHPGRWSAAVKRLLDVVVAGLGLAVLSPLMAAIAIAVWAESGGPVCFRQTRVGRGQRTFRILKFRTMVDNGPAETEQRAPGSPTPPTSCDPSASRQPLVQLVERSLFDPPDATRVTRVGRLLRRTSLDELPQLLNVVRGEMSLVGPRPFVPEECSALLGWAHRRFDVRPGITGMWQVCGQHDVTLDELYRLDVQYATSWSIRTDLRILARTPNRLFHGSAPGR